MTLPDMLLIGFTVGLTGAMMPGPMLFATIESSLRVGWTAGPRIVLGHAIVEAAACVLIIYGMSAIVNRGRDICNRPLDCGCCLVLVRFMVFWQGRTFISDRVYRRILAACGLFLFTFGLWFISLQFS